ncbi:MAG: reverse transcriptase domain-containing protein [Methyloversatilis sp.]|nr:reverse transcriptase domain-containing protein [Methyloversatilis sp.]
MADSSYKFTAYKQKLISKGADQSPRMLSIPTARDRIVLRALCQALQDVFPDAIPSLPQAKIEALKEALSSGHFQEFVRLDLRNFYGIISHAELHKAIKKRVRKKAFLELITNAVETPTIPEGSSSATAARKVKGVPQGLSISNQLAEIAINPIDSLFASRTDIAYFRYVDDILILTAAGQAKAVADEVIEQLVAKQFEPYDPSIPNSKSRFGKLSESFSFLGYQIHNGNLSVRRDSIHKLESALAAILTNYKYRMEQARTPAQREAAVRLCEWRLNLKITGCIYEGTRRGWIFYFSQINDTTCLRALQKTVASLLARFGATGAFHAKSFLKTFYESRRKDKASHKYIPNFDTMSVSQRRNILALFVGDLKVSRLSDKRVEQLFKLRIRHAVKELEADLAGLS